MTPKPFRDRREAGAVSAGRLQHYRGRDDVVVPALGGVPVAFRGRPGAAPPDVVVVRKLGAPGSPELAVGAIAGVGAVVDDGPATGATRYAASRVVVAVPVADEVICASTPGRCTAVGTAYWRTALGAPDGVLPDHELMAPVGDARFVLTGESYEDEVVAQLVDRQRPDLDVVRRDRPGFEPLQELADRLDADKDPSKISLWEHNSNPVHAPATELGDGRAAESLLAGPASRAVRRRCAPRHDLGSPRATRTPLLPVVQTTAAGGHTRTIGVQTPKRRSSGEVHSASMERDVAQAIFTLTGRSGARGRGVRFGRGRVGSDIAAGICLLSQGSAGTVRVAATGADTNSPPSELVRSADGRTLLVTSRSGSAITQKSLQTAGRPSITGPYPVRRDPEWINGTCVHISCAPSTSNAGAVGPSGGGPQATDREVIT